jgi:hypothetical protein
MAGTGGSSGGGSGIADSADAGGEGPAPTGDRPRAFQLRATYFQPKQFASTADCLTAAHLQGLPLELCR